MSMNFLSYFSLYELWHVSKPGAKFALFLLSFVNLFNYIDRYLPSAVKDLVKTELGLTDTETAAPLTMFIVVYMFTCPIFGYLADNGWSRKKLISFGIFVWSLSSALAAFSSNFEMYLVSRMMVGIGEAAYGTIAPVLLTDYFPDECRSKVLSLYYLAIPIGSAIGFSLGGYIGATYSWRAAFAICGTPGLILAYAVLFITEPNLKELLPTEENKLANDLGSKHSISDIIKVQMDAPVLSWKDTIIILWNDQKYCHNVCGLTLVTFAIGGMADWLPVYMNRVIGWSVSDAGITIGAMTVCGGLFGTLVGSYFYDKLCVAKIIPLPDFFIISCTVFLTSCFAFLSLYTPGLSPLSATIFLFITQFFLWMYTGPTNAILTRMPTSIKIRSFSIAIMIQHSLGDAISPLIVGAISDYTSSLRSAVSILPVALTLGFFVFLRGWMIIPDEEWDERVSTRLHILQSVFKRFVRSIFSCTRID